MNINLAELTGEKLLKIERRRSLIKQLSKKMILESTYERVSKTIFRIVVISLIVYFIHHDITYGHFIHLYHPG